MLAARITSISRTDSADRAVDIPPDFPLPVNYNRLF